MFPKDSWRIFMEPSGDLAKMQFFYEGPWEGEGAVATLIV